MTRRYFWGAFACVVAPAAVTAALVPSCADSSVDSSCPDDAGSHDVAVHINKGEGFGGSGGSPAVHPLVSGQYVVSGSLDNPSNVPVHSVTVGGVSATAVGPNYSTWSATLGPANLVANRVGTGETALINVVEVDECGGTATASTELRIGPDPDAGLTLAVSPPNGECYLPANAAGKADVTITASTPDYIDQPVTLGASAGTFTPASPTFELADGGDAGPVALAVSVFSIPASMAMPSTTLTLAASVTGSVSNTAQVLVAAAPRITPTSSGTGSSGSAGVTIPKLDSQTFFVDTKGRLAGCYAEMSTASPSSSSSSTSSSSSSSGGSTVTSSGVTLSWPSPLPLSWSPINPDAGPGPCDGGPDADTTTYAGQSDYGSVQVTVSVGQAAQVGATVTLRCLDTFGQEGSITIAVGSQGATPLVTLAPTASCTSTAIQQDGEVRSISVQALQGGMPKAGATVSFTVVGPPGATATPPTAITDANGYAATAVWVPTGEDAAVQVATTGSQLVCDAVKCTCDPPDGGGP